MKVQVLGVLFLCLSNLVLYGAQQKLLNNGQIQQGSLDSTNSNGSIPSVGFPDPFSFDESTLSAVRLPTASHEQDNAGEKATEQLVKNPDSATSSLESQQQRKPLGNKKHQHDRPSSDNALQSPLLIEENPAEPRTNSQMHDMYEKPAAEPLSVCRGWKLSKHVALYATLFVLGLTHGAINKHVSGGVWNEHFWNAPWREWEIGAGANVLETFAAVLCYYCFQIKTDCTQKQQDWVAWPLLMVMLGSGQAFGEVMPTPDSPGWRNCAVNMWAVPTALWYLVAGIRTIRGHYASKPLLNPSDRGLYDSM